MSAKIVIADDEADILKLVVVRLQKWGYDVITAVNGQEALDRIREHTPDIILLDYRMPLLSGQEVCQRVKADPQLKHIPIILLTASSEFIGKELLQSSQADDCLVKPFEPAVLREKIQHFVGA